MSETTLTERLRGAREMAQSYNVTGAQVELSLDEIARIASLLTEEDEKIAHNGHFDRAWSLWEANGCQSPNEAWQAWWDGICARRPSFILSQLEAAYLAAKEAEK